MFRDPVVITRVAEYLGSDASSTKVTSSLALTCSSYRQAYTNLDEDQKLKRETENLTPEQLVELVESNMEAKLAPAHDRAQGQSRAESDSASDAEADMPLCELGAVGQGGRRSSRTHLATGSKRTRTRPRSGVE